MAMHAQKEFGYQKLRLKKTEPLGSGSYGTVYKAMCDDLPCAGKILHSTFFHFKDPGAMTIMRRFQQECSFLSAIRHPNIVQFLGLFQDSETQLLVLLMELMDVSLTQFLKQSQVPLPYHTQVDISHDIALALSYLHSNDLIHRDLSSNNVLLIGAGNRAKVTDFGMAKLFSDDHTNMTPLTMCPGTLAYMSPEALDEPPIYTKKLDSFSFGVLEIQIITRQFPNPGPRTNKVRDPRSPTGKTDMPVLETERRKSHIHQICPSHPLLPIAVDCLNYSEHDRPSAQKLCRLLAALKQASRYGDSVQQAQQRSRQELQQQKEQLQQVPHGNDIDDKERQLRELKQQLSPSEQETAQSQLNREKMIHKLQEENRLLKQKLDKVSEKLMVLQGKKLTLGWKICKVAPCIARSGSATVSGNIAYFRPAGSKQVLSYNSDTEKWSTLPECPTGRFTLTVTNGLLTAVGGWQSTNYTNTLLSLVEVGEGRRREWLELFPPMPTKRGYTAVVCCRKALLVAGGYGEEITILSTVEVMNTDTLQWSTASNLPHPLSDATATVCGDRVYLVGGSDQHWKSTNSTFTCSLSALLQSLTIGGKMKSLLLAENQPVWHKITDLPVKASSSVTLNGQLLAVGGIVDEKDSNNIYTYNTGTNSWEVISHMPTHRCWCLVAVLPGNKLMVVGGETDNVDTDKVEIAELQ